jgi:hypothetical protein
MRIELLCPACGACNFDFNDYESVVLLAPNLALMQFKCPHCKIHLSATVKLTKEMQHLLQKKLDKTAAQTDDREASKLLSVEQQTVEPSAANLPTAATRPAEPPAPTQPQTDNPAATKKTQLSYSSSLIVDGFGMQYGIVRPLRSAAAELKEELDYFKNQLDTIDSVDQAIKEIDGNRYPQNYPNKRDL